MARIWVKYWCEKWQHRVLMKHMKGGSSVGINVIGRGYIMMEGYEERRNGWRWDGPRIRKGVREVSFPMGDFAHVVGM